MQSVDLYSFEIQCLLIFSNDLGLEKNKKSKALDIRCKIYIINTCILIDNTNIIAIALSFK